MQTPQPAKPHIFMRYNNRKLYDPTTATYVSTDRLFDMVERGESFDVINSSTKELYTTQVLCQMLCKVGRKRLPIDVTQVLGVLRDALIRHHATPDAEPIYAAPKQTLQTQEIANPSNEMGQSA